MASSLFLIAVFCLASGLWIGANAQSDDFCCDDCKQCPDGWTGFRDNCYKYNHAKKDWADAERFCIGQGGNLASIHNKEELHFVENLIFTATNRNDQTFVGGHDTVKEGVWLWSNGSPFDYKGIWGKGQPSNGGSSKSEHCLELNWNGAPNDVNCHVAKPFVCGIKL
ncbi:galactose-specific lectin nattectin-like [Plectropomus leopardus]|uniref:galactose-specific lectin nattectin-like n=1 Tax=Plectropomus leopardus TaxID=160734 RepID=UPI001C4C629C|nr:galactose-specific lectin nattectin-like [Plectropomus leopardus]